MNIAPFPYDSIKSSAVGQDSEQPSGMWAGTVSLQPGTTAQPLASALGELAPQRSIEDLETELAEKERYIKRLETQMLVSSVPKPVSASAKEGDIAKFSSGHDASQEFAHREARHQDDGVSWTTAISRPLEIGAHPAALDKALLLWTRPAVAATGHDGRSSCEQIMPETYDELSNTPRDSLRPQVPFTQRQEGDVDETFMLQRVLQQLEAERERKDTELRIFQKAHSLETLRREYSILMMDIRLLSDQKRARTVERQQLLTENLQERDMRSPELGSRLSNNDAPSSPITPAHWRSKATMLEEELKQKAEVVARLRQRELWFETQLRRQTESNVMPLEALLNEVRALQEGSERLSGKDTERSKMRLPEPPCAPSESLPSTTSRTTAPAAGYNVAFPAQYC